MTPRQGRVFLCGQPRTYRLRNRTRFSQTLERRGGSRDDCAWHRAPSGQQAEHQQFEIGTVRPLAVHAALGIRLLDVNPSACSAAFIPSRLAPDFSSALRQYGSITKALESCGIDGYTAQA